MVKSQKGEVMGLGTDGNYIYVFDTIIIAKSPAKGKKVALETGNIHHELMYDDLVSKKGKIVSYYHHSSIAIVEIENLKIRIPISCLRKDL